MARRQQGLSSVGRPRTPEAAAQLPRRATSLPAVGAGGERAR